MAKFERYNHLTRSQEDLITKDFCFNNILALTLYGKTSQNLNFKGSFKNLLDSNHKPYISSSALFHFKTPTLSLKQELNTSKLYKTTIQFTPASKNYIKSKLKIEENREKGLNRKTLSVDYTQDQLNAKVSFNSDKFLKFSAVAGVKNIGAGVEVGYDWDSCSLCTYKSSLFVNAPEYKAVVQHISTNTKAFSLGNIVGSLYYRVSNDFRIAGLVTYICDRPLGVKAAIQYRASEFRRIKARIDNEGLVGVSFRNRITPLVTVVTGTQFSILDAPTPHLQFGFRLKFNQ